MMVPDTAKPFNYEVAERLIGNISDPILANILRFALAQAYLQLLPVEGSDMKQWQSNLPIAPFDLAFFLRVVESMFSKTQIIEDLMAGRTPAEATGWDVFD